MVTLRKIRRCKDTPEDWDELLAGLSRRDYSRLKRYMDEHTAIRGQGRRLALRLWNMYAERREDAYRQIRRAIRKKR